MVWQIGPIELQEYEYPQIIRIDVPHVLKSVTAPSMVPYIYSMGVNVEAVQLTCLLDYTTAKQLKELLQNVSFQPVHMIAPEDYGGFYYLKSLRREGRGGVVSFETTRIDLWKVGTQSSHTFGLRVTSLSEVTNDWGI